MLKVVQPLHVLTLAKPTLTLACNQFKGVTRCHEKIDSEVNSDRWLTLIENYRFIRSFNTSQTISLNRRNYESSR